MIDPPIPLVPADPVSGSTWSAEGDFGGTSYRWEAEVTHAGPLDTVLGHRDDCITVEATLARPADSSTSIPFLDQYCTGFGWVHSEFGGAAPGASDTVSVFGVPPHALPDPVPGDDSAFAAPGGSPDDWALSRIGSAVSMTMASPASFAPVYLPTDPPAVVVATEAGGDLVALATGPVAGHVLWRLPTAGAVYSQPRYDAASGRVYVGATDGVLRALDAQGCSSGPSRRQTTSRPDRSSSTAP